MRRPSAMVRSVLSSVALLALLIYGVLRIQSAYEERLDFNRVTRVDIYADRITYRNNMYATTSLLANGLKAIKDPPRKVELHVCARMDEFADVLDVLRTEGYREFEVELPDC
jgi:hypothetical protein